MSRGHPFWRNVQTGARYLKCTSEGSSSSYVVRVRFRLALLSLNEPATSSSASPSCAVCCERLNFLRCASPTWWRTFWPVFSSFQVLRNFVKLSKRGKNYDRRDYVIVRRLVCRRCFHSLVLLGWPFSHPFMSCTYLIFFALFLFRPCCNLLFLNNVYGIITGIQTCMKVSGFRVLLLGFFTYSFYYARISGLRRLFQGKKSVSNPKNTKKTRLILAKRRYHLYDKGVQAAALVILL